MIMYRNLERAALALALPLAACALLLTGSSAMAAAPAPGDGVVNINTADPGQLALLPGIGEGRATKIVAYRAKKPFKAVVELARVKGIGLKLVRKLKPWLAVDGPTTLTTKPSRGESGG